VQSVKTRLKEEKKNDITAFISVIALNFKIELMLVLDTFVGHFLSLLNGCSSVSNKRQYTFNEDISTITLLPTNLTHNLPQFI
jgi:hypothetical protein